uniref:Uncharacterized protein n=1 Tax=Engystomops pustulosus TaxID=76066 RepID=A0AAV6YIZ4_ENGPU|nr:hypothetical protein GDO81_025991 [Engystomops pustulosus]
MCTLFSGAHLLRFRTLHFRQVSRIFPICDDFPRYFGARVRIVAHRHRLARDRKRGPWPSDNPNYSEKLRNLKNESQDQH